MLSPGEDTLQAHSEVTWIGRGVDSSWGSLPAVSSLRTQLSKHGGMFMLADAQKPPGPAVGPPGWAWGMMLPLWHDLCHVNC